MTTIRALLGALAAVALCTASAFARCDDPAAAEAVRARIASTCVCTEATNHGQHVSCVAHELRQAVLSGELPVNCKGAVVRCAARSTCGKRVGFVTCCFAAPGVCDGGLCQDGTTACTLSTECPVVTKCRTKSSTEACTTLGGSPGSGSCCDAVCSLP